MCDILVTGSASIDFCYVDIYISFFILVVAVGIITGTFCMQTTGLPVAVKHRDQKLKSQSIDQLSGQRFFMVFISPSRHARIVPQIGS
jgi:hypothetical protein